MASLDAVAAAVGITDTVARSIHHLIQIINAIKSAPTEIADLKEELIATEQVLLVLKDANEVLPPTSRDILQKTNTLCQNACDKFRVKLVSWTKNSDDGVGLHWLDRVRFGVIGPRSVKSLREHLERSKHNVNLAVGIATLISNVAPGSTTDAMRRDFQARENEITQQIVNIKEQSAAVQRDQYYSAQASLSDNQEHTLLLEQLKYQRESLDASQGLMEDLLRQARKARIAQNITNVEMSENGKVLVGRMGFEDSEGEVYQDIHNVKATTSGKGIVGVAKGFDINAFFKD